MSNLDAYIKAATSVDSPFSPGSAVASPAASSAVASALCEERRVADLEAKLSLATKMLEKVYGHLSLAPTRQTNALHDEVYQTLETINP